MICNSEKNYMVSGLNALRGSIIVGSGESPDGFPYIQVETLKHKHVFKVEASCDGEGNHGGRFIGLPKDPKGYSITAVKYRQGFVGFDIAKEADKKEVIISQDDEMNDGGFLFGLPVIKEVGTKDM